MDKKEFIISIANKKRTDEFKNFGVFIFDSCSLLLVYTFADKERKDFFNILKKLANKDRLWLPFQFLEEFEAHRLEKIKERYEYCTKLKNIIDNKFQPLKDSQDINDFANYEPLKKFKEKLKKDIDVFYKKIIKDWKKTKKQFPDWQEKDPAKKALMDCFKGKIGDPCKDEIVKKIFLDGPKRYSKFIPPGYMDAEKNRSDVSRKKQFGDLIAWFQIIDYAKTQKKPVAIITDDLKEDWWNKQNGKLFGPRIELMYEIYKNAKVDLKMFTTKEFLDYVKKELKIDIENTLLEKVKKIESKEEVSSTPLISGEPELGTGTKLDLGTPNN